MYSKFVNHFNKSRDIPEFLIIFLFILFIRMIKFRELQTMEVFWLITDRL